MRENDIEKLKRFVMTNQLLEYDLGRVEEAYGIDLQRGHDSSVGTADEVYYPQVEAKIRVEAARMAPQYELFYSLEKTIRASISESMEASLGESWWSAGTIPQKIKDDTDGRIKRETDLGITVRSDDPLDFTNFGELGEIIKANWSIFDGMFSSIKAVERVMSMLNSLRGPIAHCSPLAEDEILRLQLAMRDWFRLME